MATFKKVFLIALLVSYSTLVWPNTEKQLPHQLGTYRHLQFNTVEIDAVTLNNPYHGHIFKQTATTQEEAQSISEITQAQHAIIGINGGFYAPDFSPVGLFIENNKLLKKISKGRLLNTCIHTNGNEEIVLENNRNYCSEAASAMQTGPLLIDHGKLNPQILTPPKNAPRLQAYFDAHRRTVLARAHNQLIIMVTSPITLIELATLLKERASAFGVPQIDIALNLDGGSSTGMYIAFPDEPFYFPERKLVKTLVLFD